MPRDDKYIEVVFNDDGTFVAEAHGFSDRGCVLAVDSVVKDLNARVLTDREKRETVQIGSRNRQRS